MRSVAILAIVAAAAAPLAWADGFQGTTSTGLLDVVVTPGEGNIVVEFLMPDTEKLQKHVDYKLSVRNGDERLFGPIPLTHTTPGKVTIPVRLLDGTNTVDITVRGILFVPVDDETISLNVVLGSAVPSWVKHTAGWWAGNQIEDGAFIAGIEFLIESGVISVEGAGGAGSGGGGVPDWIKNTAGWWAEGSVSDTEFLNALKYLVSRGIISVGAPDAPGPVVIGGVDLTHAGAKGSPDATVSVIMFGDYQCPRCQSWFENTGPQVESRYVETGTAKLYFVDLVFLGTDSARAAAATYCAQDQGAYWEFHDALYTNQRGIQDGWASHRNLVSFASNLGLDTQAFESCMSNDHTERISFNREQARASGFDYTPAFIVAGPGGSTSIEGDQPFVVFDRAIQDLLN